MPSLPYLVIIRCIIHHLGMILGHKRRQILIIKIMELQLCRIILHLVDIRLCLIRHLLRSVPNIKIHLLYNICNIQYRAQIYTPRTQAQIQQNWSNPNPNLNNNPYSIQLGPNLNNNMNINNMNNNSNRSHTNNNNNGLLKLS